MNGPVQIIPIDRIRIINPRHRDRHKFQAVIDSMADVDLLSPPLPPPTKYLDLSYLERARQAER